MDIKTQVLTNVITQIVDDMSHHPNWDAMMNLTDYSLFDCEINHQEITSKIQKLLQCKEYMDLINYGNQIFDEAMTHASQEFGESLDQFSEDLKKSSAPFLP